MDSRSTAHRFASGDVVVHAKFGTGTVVAVDPNMKTNAAGDEEAKVTVRFEKVGEKSVLSSFLKLEREVHRIDSLREAVHAFGRTSVETTNLLTRFGHDLLASLKTYLHREKCVVYGVRPSGEWKANTDYRDAAFSVYDRPILSLDPIDLGVGIRIDNLRDNGALWIRLVVTLRKAGDRIYLNVGDRGELSLPVPYEGHLEAACALVFDTALKLFTEDVEHDRAGYYGTNAPIGFIKERPSKP